MKKVIVIFIVLLLTGCGGKEALKITAQEVNTMIENQEEFLLVDVRTKEEYDEEHIMGAINIPLNEIESTTILDKESKIVVYCQSGNRSATAAKKLLKQGYLSVYDLGGIIDWTYEMESN